jgi:hypothetical protein
MTTRVVLVALAVVVLLSGGIAFGLFDFLAPDGRIDRLSAIGSLSLYWSLLLIVLWIIPIGFRYWKHSVLLIASSVISLACAEVAARILVPGSTSVRMMSGGLPSPELHHMLPPNARMYVGEFEGKHVFLDTNEHGLRTEYSMQAFLRHRERVIVLGDSFAFGLGVTHDDAFAKRLEGTLRQAAGHDDVAVLNAGIISYSPFLERLLLERRLVEYRPTFVLLLLDATDIGDDHRYMSEAIQKDGTTVFALRHESPTPYRGALFELSRPYHHRFLTAVKYPVDALRAVWTDGATTTTSSYDYYEFTLKVGDTLEDNRFFIYRHPLEKTRRFFDQTLRNVDETARLAQSIGAGFALVVTPRFHHWNPREAPENWEAYKYKLNEPHQFEYFRYFDEASAGRNYPIINLLPDFQATDKYPLVFHHDPHWNANGHAFAADAVHRHLAHRKLSDFTQPPASRLSSVP